MKRIVTRFSALMFLCAAVMVTGCGGQVYNRKHYVLETTEPARAASADANSVLEVQRFTIDSAFRSTGLVYRTSEFEYETDFYNHWLISPADMITEKTRNRLAAANLWMVLDRGSDVEPTHTLKANITALYGDFRDEAAPKAVMEIRFFLTTEEKRRPGILLAGTYEATSRLQDKNAEGLVQGFDRCLADILTELEADLRKKL